MDIKSEVFFDPQRHLYFNDKNEIYKSCTQLLSLYKPKFDAEKISVFVAKKRGITKEEVLAEWKATADKANAKGTLIHNIMERYILSGEKNSDYPDEMFTGFDDICSRRLKINVIVPEMMLWNHEHKVAGTSDIVLFHPNNKFSILDYKTNREFTFNDKYNQRLKYPLNHLSNTHYNGYGLQLSIYGWMLEQITGMQMEECVILYQNINDFTWKEIPVNSQIPIVKLLMSDYKKNHTF